MSNSNVPDLRDTRSTEMQEGETYQLGRLKLTHMWGMVKLESIGMQHSSASRRGGYRATAEAKHLFGWPKNLSKEETFRRVDELRQKVIDGGYEGMTWVYPMPVLPKEVLDEMPVQTVEVVE